MAYKNNRTKNRRRYKTRYHNPHNYKAKRTDAQNRAAVMVAVLTFVVVASMVVVFTFGDSIYDWLDGKMQAITATPLEATVALSEEVTLKPTEPPTEPPTEAPTEPPQQAEFIALCNKNGINDLKAVGNQIIFADTNDSDPTRCSVYCYEKGDDGVFSKVLGPFEGYVGIGGVSATVAPYEEKTPTGVFKIEFAMGSRQNPGTGLEYIQFTTQSWWVTDPDSVNYNRYIESEYEDGWASSQWLYEYIYSYPYAVVFDYNRSTMDPSQGCAKFLHVSDTPTKGGIGISEWEIQQILYWLNISQKPYIAISQ